MYNWSARIRGDRECGRNNIQVDIGPQFPNFQMP